MTGQIFCAIVGGVGVLLGFTAGVIMATYFRD